MSVRTKNIVSVLLAIIIVWFLFFAILYWIFDQGLRESIEVAGAGSIGGWLAPILVNYIKKRKNNQRPEGK